MTDLFQRSIEIILENQRPNGAYLASPNFPTYHFCWFRDGAYIAYAMDLVGKHQSAERFHDWAASVINLREDTINRVVDHARQGKTLNPKDYLHTRYTVDGQASNEDWPNFQLDGFGTWLWSLAEHCRLSGSPPSKAWLKSARLTADYLKALWRFPCYDCWEEFPEKIHAHTLATTYGGLQSHQVLSGTDHHTTLQDISTFIQEHVVNADHFVKYVGSREVDASLIALATPYQVVQPTHPVIKNTILKIEADLICGGGVHRYGEDTYYGGGEWVLLTAWLGWYYTQIGEDGKARQALGWIREQSDVEGQLPEQVPDNLNDPASYEPWQERWGDIAKPLLWSHAKFIILSNALLKGNLSS